MYGSMETTAENMQKEIIKKQTKEVSMVFIGDLMYHNPQLWAAKKGDAYIFEKDFEYLKPLINSGDISMANLETTLANDGNYSGYPQFRTPHTIIKDMKNIGIDVLATANNHSLDGGVKGIHFSLDTIDEAGLMHTGTCRENEENLPLIIEENGIKLGIICSTYGANGLVLPEGKEYMLNYNHSIDIDKNIDYLRKNEVDGIIYFIHWGNEYERQFTEQQHELAMKLFDKGVNWIIGSHPHVIEGSEFFEEKNQYVLYSLGNVISNQRWRYSDTGLLAKLNFRKVGKEPLQLIKAEYHPFWVDKYDENGIVDYKIIPILENEIPDTNRLSSEDRRLMGEALRDFRELYPEDLIIED